MDPFARCRVLYGFENELSLWRGWAVFEAIEARGTTLFHWEDHYARLLQSCALAHIPFDQASQDIKKIVKADLQCGGQSESLVKILVTRGRSEDHHTPIADTSSFLVSILPLPHRSPRPLKLEVQEGIREFPHIKLAGGYGYTMIRKEIATANGYDDFLYSSPETGITESSIGNIFFIWRDQKGALMLGTPGRAILHGVTRHIVLDIARGSDIFAEVNDTTFTTGSGVLVLSESIECFITSTTFRIHPVESIILSRMITCGRLLRNLNLFLVFVNRQRRPLQVCRIFYKLF